MSSRSSNSDCKVFVGDLPSGVSRQDLEDAFNRYGYLKSVWVARNPPGFAFIEFEDSRDARDAVKEVDGTRIGGKEVKVEISSGRSRRGGGGGGSGGGGGGYGGGGGGGYGGRPPPRRDMRNESCYACGERGHFARDCSQGRRPGDGARGGGGGGGRDREYNRDSHRSSYRSRSRSRSRSDSPPRRRRYSRSRSRSNSPAQEKE